jgi:hypothetical protein
MLRLTIEGNEIELYENEPINLSYQFSNLQEINASASSFSQTFRVPLTKKNQEYFGAVNEFGLITTWDPKTKASAELTSSTIPIMRGFIQVKGVYVQKGKYADVEIVFFGETANLSRDIGNGMLTDLDLSTYEHDLNATNLEASWVGTLFNGVIRYGLPDKGQNWTNENIWSASNPLEHGDFTPYFRASKLLEEILTDAGYTMESDFFDGATGFEEIPDLYLLMNRGNRTPIGLQTPQTATILVGYQTDESGLFGNTFSNFPSFSQSSPFYDTGNNFTGVNYTPPFRAYYTFRINIYGRLSHSSNNISIRLAKQFSTSIFDAINNMPSAIFDDVTHSFLTPPILLSPADNVSLQYKNHDSSHTLAVDGDGSISPESTWWEIVEITDPTSDQEVDVAANMPEMKQIDFVSGLQKMFNLVFIPDRNNVKKLYIEPLNTYISSGTSKDWTNKIDLSKDIQIQPTTDLQARRYDWTYSPGKDLVNDIVQSNADRTYGRYRVDDPGNDFASGNKEIKTPFAPFVASLIPETGWIVHRMLLNTDNEEKTLQNPKPRIAFWNGLVDSAYWNFGNAGVQTQFPTFTGYSTSPNALEVDDESLLYGTERPFYHVTGTPLNNLYYKYWRPFVNELYSSDARKLTAFFRLTRSELATFEFSDKIYLKDTYWRILSISYDATSEGLVKVEMLKVLGDIRDCTFLPYEFNKDGRVRFTNVSGTVVDQVSRQCCERYGYSYDNSTAFCWTTQPQ